MLQKLKLSSAALVFMWTMWVACAANAGCIDVKQTDGLSFRGMLSHQIFPGPPNFEDVRKGDAREPAYILTLDAPACAVGDDFLNASESFDRIQLLPNDARPDPALSRTLRRLVGKRVVAVMIWGQRAPMLLNQFRKEGWDAPSPLGG